MTISDSATGMSNGAILCYLLADKLSERIAAIAQPNYTAFMGKDELDVYKLEHMEYGPDEQRNWMRTVHSPNGSAVCDDGYLAFVRGPEG